MNNTGTEIETKYLIREIDRIEARLQSLGACCIQKKQFERNLRFDLPDGILTRSYRVLRLRQDENVVLTYKGPGSRLEDGIRSREELEVYVSDFPIMQKILESLGFQIQFIYEKYRTTFELDQARIMLDKMPFGDFVEIEGNSNSHIKRLAEQLNLDSSKGIPDSYQVLFERVKKSLNLSFRDLTFENFKVLVVSASDFFGKFADTELK